MPSNSGFLHEALLAGLEERLLVGIDHALPRRVVELGRQPADRMRQAEADDAAHLVRVGRGQRADGEGLGHRHADRRLPVAERAVAVEHGEFDRHSANLRISAAIAGEPFASSASATRRRSSGACSATA